MNQKTETEVLFFTASNTAKLAERMNSKLAEIQKEWQVQIDGCHFKKDETGAILMITKYKALPFPGNIEHAIVTKATGG